jgi:ABC-type Mn2+/Zn2+ transport system permease subunit
MEFLTDPSSWWLDPFRDNEFMREALLAALLTVVTTSLVGTWVVLRGLSFFGDALAHGVLPGIAIATIAGFSTTLGAAAAAVVMVLGVNAIRQFSPLPDDTSIGVLFVGFLALAVVVMSSPSASQSGDLDSFLFGSINAIDGADLRRQIVVAAATIVGIAVLYRALLVTTFDETLARTMGFRPRLVHGVLLVMLAMAIVASFETVGNLLVVAFLIAPPATAALVTRRVPVMMATAVLLGSLAAVVGLLVSYHHRTGTGATMALSTVVLFLVVLVGSTVVRQLTMRRHADIHPA